MKRPRNTTRSLPVLPTRAAAPVADPEAVDAAAPRLGLLTLGCDKNTVDSERILAWLQNAGAAVTRRPDEADVVVINTCGFIDMAKQESIDTILEAVRLKEEGRVQAVVAMGCLVQRYKHELEAELPEVDLFLGLMETARLLPELRRRGILPTPSISDRHGRPSRARARDAPGARENASPADRASPIGTRSYGTPLRVRTSDTPHTAPLKISEGCDHGCAFCAIPLMRGQFRSTPVSALVREARELEAAGVVELSIVSQDTTWYGRDRRLPPDADAASHAVRPASAAETASHPRFREQRRTEAVGGSSNVARRESTIERPGFFYGRPFPGMAGLDLLPLDEVDDGRTMAGGRSAVGGRSGALPHLLRTLLAETTIPWLRLFYMYPSGITRELVDLVAGEPRLLPYLDMPIQHGSDRMLKRMRRPERRRTILERVAWLRAAVPDVVLRTTVIVGFPGERDEDFDALIDLLEEVRFDHLGAFAYSEEEGTAAAGMDGGVSRPLRQERLDRLMDVQRAILQEKGEARLGVEAGVLVDEVVGGDAVGRGWWQAPEVDGVVRLAGAGHLAPGQFVTARLTSVSDGDFEGIVTREEPDE